MVTDLREADAPFANPTVLVVDDDENIIRLIQVLTQGMDQELVCTTDPLEGIRLLEQTRPEVVMVDMKMPRMDGLEFIRRGMALCPDSSFVLMTGHASMEILMDAIKLGIHDYLAKPFQSPEALRLVIINGLSQARLKTQLKYQARMTEAIMELNAADFQPGGTVGFVELISRFIKDVTDAPVMAWFRPQDTPGDLSIDAEIPMTRAATLQLAARLREALCQSCGPQVHAEPQLRVKVLQPDKTDQTLNCLGSILLGEVHSLTGIVAIIMAAHPKRKAFSELSVRMTESLCLQASLIARSRATTFQQEAQRMANVLWNLSDGIVLLDRRGLPVDMNARARTILGVGDQELSQSELQGLLAGVSENPDLLAGAQEAGSEDPVIKAQLGSETRFFRIRSWDMPDPGGRVQKVLVMDDVTTVKQEAERLRPIYDQMEKLNRELTRRNKDLERVNRELDNFAYIASHDLREPFRHIEIFTQFLENDLSGELDGETAYLFNQIKTNARIADRLLTDLRTLSRVTRTRNPYRQVNMDDLVWEVLKRFEFPIMEKNISLTMDNLGEAICDRTKIQEVFHNLISNAIKYNDKENPRIHISSTREEDSITFKVEDNGLGIAPEYHEYIFQPCRRIPFGDAEGSGLGLTITRKIVDEHQGRIWVESKQGRGATFIFSLPLVQEVEALD